MNKTISIMAATLALFAAAPTVLAGDVAPSGAWQNSPTAKKVRAATAAFRDPQAALAAGYLDTGHCVSGRDGGGMGVHFVNPALLLDDGSINVNTPEVLIYEPLPSGRLRLVGVEYLSIDDGDPNTGSPVLDGHLLNYSSAPNRYGLPAHHELHVWAWKYNPDGTFADWNPRVSCDAYKIANGMGGH